MPNRRESGLWSFVERVPPRVSHRALLFPGLLLTDFIYADMLADPSLDDAGVALAAVNPPGFRGQPVPPGFDYSMESYADLVEELAANEGADVLVGHSLFGNVLIEVAARGRYRGKLVLISPSLYRQAEGSDTRTLDSLSRVPVVAQATWALAYMAMDSIMKPYFTEEKKDRLPKAVAEAKMTSRPGARQLLLSLFRGIDKHQDLTARLASTNIPTWYIRGEQDNIGFCDEVRAKLAASPKVKIRDVPGSRHMVMIDRPQDVLAVIREAIGAPAAEPVTVS